MAGVVSRTGLLGGVPGAVNYDVYYANTNRLVNLAALQLTAIVWIQTALLADC